MSASDDRNEGRGSRRPDRKAERAARLGDELRANLQRRKEQARLRAAPGGQTGPPEPASPPDPDKSG